MTHFVAPPDTILAEADVVRRQLRMRDLARRLEAREFVRRKAGMTHAMDGGLWMHRHIWQGRPMVHLVSTNRDRLLEYGRALGIPEARLQFKPLKDPRTGVRRDAWHWDLGGPVLPPVDAALFDHESSTTGDDSRVARSDAAELL